MDYDDIIEGIINAHKRTIARIAYHAEKGNDTQATAYENKARGITIAERTIRQMYNEMQNQRGEW